MVETGEAKVPEYELKTESEHLMELHKYEQKVKEVPGDALNHFYLAFSYSDFNKHRQAMTLEGNQ